MASGRGPALTWPSTASIEVYDTTGSNGPKISSWRISHVVVNAQDEGRRNTAGRWLREVLAGWIDFADRGALLPCVLRQPLQSVEVALIDDRG
jgi:hypothetical protein